MSKTITVVIADDHEVVLRGLKAMLEGVEGIHIVGQASDGLGAVQAAERLKPDILVVDMMMPGINGLEVTRQVCRRRPDTKVVILSMHSNEAYVVEAMRAGAKAYVLKAADAEELLTAVKEAIAGRRYLSRALSDRAIEAYLERAQEGAFDVLDTLTEREREVLQMVAMGHSNTAMAEMMGISPRTAETHRGNMMRKLGLKNQTDVIRFAIQHGMISEE
jgi:two-component system, NarL family, response regulator NreC